MLASTPTMEDVKSLMTELYDVDSRPEKVKDLMTKVGFDVALSKMGMNGSADKFMDAVASMTTVAGLKLKKDEAMEIAAPYIAKAKDAEGRAELLEEIKSSETVAKGKAIATAKIVEPVSAKIAVGKEMAAPYVASAKEYADPYVQKVAELRNSERVESMMKAFNEAREHPAEKVGELRAKAVDLIRYENLRAYRDHVMSPQFQADTIQLVKEDLPAIAASAAKRGAEGVKATANKLKEEVDKYGEKAKALVPSEEELKAAAEKVKTTGAALLAELQTEIASGVAHVKTEGFSLEDTIDRLKRVIGLVDKMVVSPLISTVASKEESAAEEEEGAAEDEPPVSGDEEMHDAQVLPAEADEAPIAPTGGRKDGLGIGIAVASTVALAAAATTLTDL